MSDSLHPWILVNQYMQDEKFREVVIRTALEHLPRASHELRRHVSRIFARLVVPGFQSFFKANTPLSRHRVVPVVDKAFRSDPNVTAAVISLWSEVSNGLIEELKTAAVAAGLCFKENWTWREAQNGFIDFRAIPALIQVAESLAAGRPYPEPDHLRLAVLWLSGALLRDANSNSDQPMALCDEALEPRETAGDCLMNAANGETPLPQAKDDLEQCVQTLSLIVQSIESDVRALSSAVEASDLDGAMRWHREVGTKLEKWRATQEALNKTVTSLSAQLEAHFGSRPDLVIPQGEPGASLFIQAKILQEAIERIMAYDSEKAALVSDLKRMLPELWAQVGHIREWGQEISEPIESLPSDNILANLTLTEVKGYVARLTEVYRSHDETLQRLRADAQARIKRTVAELKAEGEPEDSRAAGIPLGVLDSRKISELSDDELRLLESQLASLLQARRQAKIPQSQILAAALRENWTDNGLYSLLSSLVHEQQKEAALLLLFAGTAFHPSDSPLTIDDTLAVTLIDAAVAWSSDGRPYELFGALVPDLIRVAAPEPGVAQARLCLALLGAQYGGDFRVPTEVVWQVATEWPLPSMPGWARLWETVAAEEPLPQITSTSVLDDHEVNEWRARAAGNLQREKGTFLRLQGLQSHRHRAVFSRSLMPVLASHLAKLQELEEKLKKAKEETTYRSLLTELEDVVRRQLTFRLAEDQVEEWYESEISAAQVDDAHPFHHRTALRLLQECAESVLQYGEKLLQYYDLRFAHRNALRLEALLMELQPAGGLVSLGDKVLQWVIGKSLGARSWTEAERRKEVGRQIVKALLNDPRLVLRMPRVAGYLVEHEFDWTGLLDPLLQDLAEPVDVSSAVSLLLEHDALNPLLQMNSNVTLEQRTQAQTQSLGYEREIRELQTTLMSLGGTVEDVEDYLSLGRWRLARKVLQERIAECQAQQEAKERSQSQQARQLRREVNELDNALFEASPRIPRDIFELMQQGLELSRQALGQLRLLDEIDVFVREMRYRLDHAAWSATDIQTAIDRLAQSLRGETVISQSELTADRVLDLLDRNEISRLGLSPSLVDPTEIETRAELLRSWIQIRSMKGFLYEEQRTADREAIQRLIRHFTQMVSLKQERAQGGTGRPIAYESPFVFSHWRLQYPKTNVLDSICILLALPGQPPSPFHLSQLEQIIESKDWLKGEFVILFVPGCTPAIQKRLQANYRKRGLVVIDEQAILDLVLAERQGSNPVGRLRPKMLNSLEAESVDVFKVNQLVNPRTAIFVGRDALIRRLAQSGDSYALYGGRRIGKSSVLAEVQRLLERKGVMTVLHSWEGEKDYSDDACAVRLGNLLRLEPEVHDLSEFKAVLQAYLDANSDLSLVLLMDEIDKYIVQNPRRHGLIEALRSLSDRYGGRFRVIVAGFISLYDCLHGRGPYTPTSDPWRRMFNDIGPVENLPSVSAEKIVREGFIEILGWNFEKRSIPQLIVQRTGGHPAFVQEFCRQLQHRIGQRDDHMVRVSDVEAVFADRDPEQSFVAYIRKTLEMNLDPVGRILLLWLATVDSGAHGFTLEQMREYASLCSCAIHDDKLQRSLELLQVNSVVRQRTAGLYEFTVPDYPLILAQLGQTALLDKWQREMEKEI